MKIRVFINSNMEENEVDKIDDNFYFYFNSVEAYKNFRSSFSLSQKFKNNSHENTTLSEVIQGINLSKFKKLFKRVKPILRYNYEQIENIDIPVIVDLSGLSFKDKISILTNPLVTGKNLFFMDEYTTGEYITLKDMINMYQTIILDAEVIKKNTYSQTEAIYYIYQKYKERIYKKEGKKEKRSISRSLNQIIKRDNIVCVGYSNYLNAIASILNLNVFPLSWNDANNPYSGHQENIAIINDEKHKIKGVFAIDITWDSKRNNKDEHFQNNINHFLVPMAIDELEKKHKGLVLPSDMFYYATFDRYKRLLSFEKKNVPDCILRDGTTLVVKSINHLYQMLGMPSITFECDLEDETVKVKSLGKATISLDTLKNIINNVTPRSEEDLNIMIRSSYHYQAKIAQARLLRAIFGTKK